MRIATETNIRAVCTGSKWTGAIGGAAYDFLEAAPNYGLDFEDWQKLKESHWVHTVMAFSQPTAAEALSYRTTWKATHFPKS